MITKPADSISSLTGNMRNSSIELLRLISMFMIVSCHYVRGYAAGEYGIWIAKQPLSFNKFIFQVFYMSGGWIGDVIFFTISVWFLLDRHISVKNSFKRIWLLERELLFWSIVLCAVTFFTNAQDRAKAPSLAVQALFPLSFNIWWYPTSYALFLLFLPYASRGLQALGKKMHGSLVLSLLTIWGVADFIPQITFNLEEESVFVFLYLFILISYYKWYMKDFSNKTCILLIITGFAVNSVYWLLANLIYQHTGKLLTLQNYPLDHWMITEIAIGFGIFLLFSRKEYYSKFINTLAGSAFGVYLIHSYPGIRDMLMSPAPVSSVYNGPYPILMAFVCILSLYCFCLAFDLLRQGLFNFTINRKRGACFEKIYMLINKKIHSLYKSQNTSQVS